MISPHDNGSALPQGVLSNPNDSHAGDESGYVIVQPGEPLFKNQLPKAWLSKRSPNFISRFFDYLCRKIIKFFIETVGNKID